MRCVLFSGPCQRDGLARVMRGFFSSLKPLVRLSLGLVLLALVGELMTRAMRWTGIRPVFLLAALMLLVVVAVLLTALYLFSRRS
jgi:hypothetical protein